MTMMKCKTALLAAALCFSAAGAKEPRTDAYGDPLPSGALLRLGTVRWRDHALFLAFLPGGKTLVTAERYFDHTIRFWDAATGKETATYDPGAFVAAFALAPDGKSMALNLRAESKGIVSESKGIVFASVPDGKELRRIDDKSTYFHILCFSPDGKLLAGVGGDHSLRVWDAANGKEILRLEKEGTDDFSSRLAFSPDGKKLAVGERQQTLRLLDVATGMELFKRALKRGQFTFPISIAFTPDGKKLLWAGEGYGDFALRDAATGEPLLSFRVPTGTAARPVAFSANGKLIASIDESDNVPPTIGLWDAATGKELRKLTAPVLNGMDAEPVFSADGKRLAYFGDGDGLLHVCDVETGHDLALTGEHQSIVFSAAFSIDGRTAITGCADGIIRFWDADKGTVARRINVPDVKSRSWIVFSNDRKIAAVVNTGVNDKLWDMNSGKLRAELEGTKDTSRVVHFTPDGKTLFSRERKRGIQFWDSVTGKKVNRINDNGSGELTLSPDDKTLVAERNNNVPHDGGPTELSFWDVTLGKEIRQWVLPNREWRTLQFGPSGSLIAGTVDGGVDLRDVVTGKELPMLRVPKNAPMGGRFFYWLAFSPDGRTLAAGGMTGLIYLWEISTAKVRAVLVGHRDQINSLDFSPDSSRLLSGSDDATALIWDLTGLADETDAKPLTQEQLTALWNKLADEDAGKAWRAGWRLAADPGTSVPFLQKHMRPAEVDASRIAKLMAALDGDTFEGREEASRELAKLGDLAEPALRKALAAKPSLEARRRLEELLDKLNAPVTAPEQIRSLRGVEVLEHIGSPEARRLLDELSQGADGARLTRDAKAALERLSTRKDATP